MDQRSLPKRILAALKQRATVRDTRGMHEYTTRETSPQLAQPKNEAQRHTGGRFGWR
jgi:hypothetical protein